MATKKSTKKTKSSVKKMHKPHTHKTHVSDIHHQKASHELTHHAHRPTPKADTTNWYGVIALLAVVVILGVIAFMVTNRDSVSVHDDGVIAFVNGEPLTQSAFEEMQAAVLQSNPMATREVIINQSILLMLLEQEVNAQGITVSAEEVEQMVDQQMNMIYAQFDDQELAMILADMGMTMDSFIERAYQVIEMDLRIGRLVSSQVHDFVTPIDENQARMFYEQNAAMFSSDMVDASHILICFEGTLYCASSMSRQEALSLARSVQDQYDGTNFADLARQYSADPSGEDGGHLGEFGRGMMVEEFEQAAFSQPVGVLSDPVETMFGFHLILVHERTVGTTPSFEEVAPFIMQQLENDAFMAAERAYIESLMSQASIEIVG